jgi:2-C-methyl-D-erythritol 4-phosphate cytidylyltransferase
MKALILAIGRGTRIRSIHGEHPKCLISCDGEAILDHQIQGLFAADIREIGIVVGYKRLPHDSSMERVISGGFVPPRLQLWPRESFRIVAWNIDRGTHLTAILEFLKECKADLIFLQEVDLNARRTQHVDCAKSHIRFH